MSRRKQAKPRSLKRDDEWEDQDTEAQDMAADEQESEMEPLSPCRDQSEHGESREENEEDWIEEETVDTNGVYEIGTPPPEMGDHDNTMDSLESEALTTPGSSWRSSTPEGGSPGSPGSPGSNASPHSERELSFTLGATEHTPYQCQFCDKAFPRLSYLKKHEQTHSDQMPFRCDFCSRLFKHKRSRDRHVKLHTGDRKYRCAHCEAAFSRSDHLKIHMKTHDNQKPFQCTVCNRGYNTAAALTSHMQNHKRAEGGGGGGGRSPLRGGGPGRGYRCLQCGERFRRPDLLQSHMTAVHSSDVSSSGSPRAPPALTPPSPRPRSISLPKLACMYCTRDTFTTMEQLQGHVHSMHSALLPPPPPLLPEQNGLTPVQSPVLTYSCDSCTMRFPSSSSLHQHIASAHSKLSPRSPLSCNLCSIPFASPAGLAEHYLLVHGGPSEQLRPTDLSKKTTVDRPMKRPRSGEDPMAAGTLLCNQCGAALPDFESFRVHLRAHLEGGACLSCSTCGARFSDAGALERHAAAHLLALGAEFGCPSCSRAFPKPDELQKHLMDLHAHHLYRCAICKEMFDSKVAIQVHFAVKHSHECKVYKCTACASPAATFRSEAEFTLHVRGVHAGVGTAAAGAARCPYCHAACATDLELQFHLAAHAEQYRCPLCREGFHVEFLLDKHMQQHHQQSINGDSPKPKQSPTSRVSVKTLPTENNNTKKEANICDICDRSDFHSENEVLAHRKLAHHVKGAAKNGAVSLSCAYCSENCKSRAELENHMKSHSQGSATGGKHKCLICDEVFPSSAILAEHKLTHCKVLGGNNCTHCKTLLTTEEQFFSHLSQHSNNNNAPSSPHSPTPLNLPTSCVVCRQTLVSDVEARIHARFHLKNSGLSPDHFQCALCLKSFSQQEVIPTGAEVNNGIPTTHVCRECYRQHSGAVAATERRCGECHMKFESTSALDSHVETVHRKTYTCIECQATFESEQEVRVHVQAHVSGGGLECRLCRRSLGSPMQLQAHLIEHTFAGCGGFTCYLCSAVFTAASGLQHHMLAHGLAARPYDCARCGLKFFFRAELDNHSYSHLEDDVRMKLADSDSLKHSYFMGQNGFHGIDSVAFYTSTSPSSKKMKVSNSPGPYKCSECPADFNNMLGLHAHKRKHSAERESATPEVTQVKNEDIAVKQEAEEKGDEYIEVSSPIAKPENNGNLAEDLSASNGSTPLLSPKIETLEE